MSRRTVIAAERSRHTAEAARRTRRTVDATDCSGHAAQAEEMSLHAVNAIRPRGHLLPLDPPAPSRTADPPHHLSAQILVTTHRRPSSGEPLAPSCGATLRCLDALPGTDPLPPARHPPLPPLPRRATLHDHHDLDAPPAADRLAPARHPLSLPPGPQTHLLQPSLALGPDEPPAATHPRSTSPRPVNCSCRSTATPATGQSPLAPLYCLLHRAKDLPLTSDGSGVRVQSRSPPQSPSHWPTCSWGGLDLQLEEVSTCRWRPSRIFSGKATLCRERCLQPYLLVGICKLSSFCSCSTTAKLRKSRG
ncbi:inactive histone-lysine N-methyltransferase 2E [Triticum aestivum]|uniref:inactive histone-lysine N-methyltransferase 2E n=1 Tax=Triticum aestivum TaxID=4565 RepID=UPI001D02CBAD|nr:inactive histone-lysine N-methyltransferase 2E-like [Triticum aestivum]